MPAWVLILCLLSRETAARSPWLTSAPQPRVDARGCRDAKTALEHARSRTRTCGKSAAAARRADRNVSCDCHGTCVAKTASARPRARAKSAAGRGEIDDDDKKQKRARGGVGRVCLFAVSCGAPDMDDELPQDDGAFDTRDGSEAAQSAEASQALRLPPCTAVGVQIAPGWWFWETPTVGPQDPQNIFCSLREGNAGAAVLILQRSLMKCWDQQVDANAYYGPKTRAAVSHVQRAIRTYRDPKFVVDGIFGPATNVNMFWYGHTGRADNIYSCWTYWDDF
jgi:hypothetical protein